MRSISSPTSFSTRRTSAASGRSAQGQELELAADHRQRRAQLVRRVGDERRLAIEGVLHAVEHVIERLGQHAHLVLAIADLHPRRELPAVDARGHARHPAQRGRHARGDHEAAGQRGQDRQRAGEQELVAHGALGAVGGSGRLAHPQARDDAAVRARASRTSSWMRPPSGSSWKLKPGGADRKLRAARFSCACSRALSCSSGGASAEQLGLVADGATADGDDEEHVVGRAKRLVAEVRAGPRA